MTPGELVALSVIPPLLAVYVQVVVRVWLRLGEPVDYYLMRALRWVAQQSDRLDLEIDAAMAARKEGRSV